MARLSRSKRKKLVRELVESRSWDKLRELIHAPSGFDTGPLILALAFDLDDQLRWRAIEALGRWSAEVDHEEVRDVIRRVLWLMNDESGGLAWHGPEVIGEILYNVPALIPEYGRIVATFIHEDPFGPGAHWAIARLAPVAPEAFEDRVDELRGTVDSEDPASRAYSVSALAQLRPRLARKHATRLQHDHAEVWGYDFDRGEPTSSTVADVAQEVLDLSSAAA